MTRPSEGIVGLGIRGGDFLAGFRVGFADWWLHKWAISSIIVQLSGCGAVGSAFGWGPRGRRFKSCHPDQCTYA